jgi:hypothetical protein
MAFDRSLVLRERWRIEDDGVEPFAAPFEVPQLVEHIGGMRRDS